MPIKTEDRIAALKKKIGDANRPSVSISIEERHIGKVTIDPAAETEVMLFSTGSGFKVLEGGKADVIIKGEGFSVQT